MSPVDARFPRSRLATLFFVKISMFATEISVTEMRIFPYEHFSPVTGTKPFKQTSFALTVLVVFLEFITVDRAEISHKNIRTEFGYRVHII